MSHQLLDRANGSTTPDAAARCLARTLLAHDRGRCGAQQKRLGQHGYPVTATLGVASASSTVNTAGSRLGFLGRRMSPLMAALRLPLLGKGTAAPPRPADAMKGEAALVSQLSEECLHLLSARFRGCRFPWNRTNHRASSTFAHSVLRCSGDSGCVRGFGRAGEDPGPCWTVRRR